LTTEGYNWADEIPRLFEPKKNQHLKWQNMAKQKIKQLKSPGAKLIPERHK
jgi:hypothetical protein